MQFFKFPDLLLIIGSGRLNFSGSGSLNSRAVLRHSLFVRNISLLQLQYQYCNIGTLLMQDVEMKSINYKVKSYLFYKLTTFYMSRGKYLSTSRHGVLDLLKCRNPHIHLITMLGTLSSNDGIYQNVCCLDMYEIM